MGTPSKHKQEGVDRPLPKAVTGTAKYTLHQLMAMLGQAGGKKGGKAKVPKGFARISPAKRAKAVKKSIATRKAKARGRRASEKA